MRHSHKLMVCSGICILLAAAFYFNSGSIPGSARTLPLILCGIVVLLSVILMLQALREAKQETRQKNQSPQEEAQEKQKEEPVESKTNYKRVILFTVLLIFYITLIEPVGYFIVTPIFLFACLYGLKVGKIGKILLISVGFTVFVYLLFVLLLRLPIPMGLLR